MDGGHYEQFFLQPREPWHRRYEALRAVFVEGESMAEVAQRLDVAHGTVRNWASEFRKQQDSGQTPPFSTRLIANVTAANRTRKKRSPGRRSPTRASSRWNRDAGFGHDWRACSCSGRCWPNCDSIGSSAVPRIPVPRWCRP